MSEHPLVGARVLAWTPDHYHGLPPLQHILANIPRVEAGVVTGVAETAFGETVYALIDGKERPEPFARSAIQIIPTQQPADDNA